MTDKEIVNKFNEYFEKAMYSTEMPPRIYYDNSFVKQENGKYYTFILDNLPTYMWKEIDKEEYDYLLKNGAEIFNDEIAYSVKGYDTSYASNDYLPVVPNRENRRKQEKNKSNSNIKSSIGVIGHISTKNKNKENFNRFVKGKVR